MPKVSVITTVYNGKDYFDRAESSILGQTYDDYEWIIVDDGSTDGTQKLLQNLDSEDDKVHIFSPGRLGRAKALNFGVNKASGEYIAIHDFDDISYSNRLNQQVKFLDSNKNVGVVGSYYVLNDEIRDEKYVREPPTNNKKIQRAFARYIPFAHTLVMFRKRVWEEVGGYPLSDNLIDLQLWIKIASETSWRFSNVPETLGEHFVHEQSFWNRNFEYTRRQHDLARLHARAIREIDLPYWMYVYVAGRLVYPHFPTRLKRIVRRTIGQSNEKDI